MLFIFNIIVISLILSTLKFNPTVLNCGIFAWIGSDPKQFNPHMFNILGIKNEKRGGDGCGIYSPEVLFKKSLNVEYDDFLSDIDLISVKLKVPFIIGHTRKSSRGGNTVDNLQPIVMQRREDKVHTLALAHNGTITNTSELSKRYKNPVDKLDSDTVLLSQIIDESRKNWKVLSEYEGTAAIVFAELESEVPTLHAFKGASKSYGGSKTDEERPLYYLETKDNGIFISSIKQSLKVLRSKGDPKVQEFEGNFLYTITAKDGVVKGKKYNRSEMVQNNYACSGRNWDKDYGNGYYNKPNNQLPFGRDTDTKNSFGFTRDGIPQDICNYVPPFDKGIEYRQKINSGYLYYLRGAYFDGHSNTLAHGKYVVNNWGRVPKDNDPLDSTLTRYVLYFVYGIPMINKTAYDEVMSVVAAKTKIASALDFHTGTNYNRVVKDLKDGALHPFTLVTDVKKIVEARYERKPHMVGLGNMRQNLEWVKAFDKNGDVLKANSTYFTGVLQPMFNNRSYYFVTGSLRGVKTHNTITTIEDYIRISNKHTAIPFLFEPQMEKVKEDEVILDGAPGYTDEEYFKVILDDLEISFSGALEDLKGIKDGSYKPFVEDVDKILKRASNQLNDIALNI